MDWTEQLRLFREANPDLPEGPADAPEEEPSAAATQRARLNIGISRKGRAGKTVTLVSGWELTDEQLGSIATDIKKRLGAGGSLEDGPVLLIQGDRRKQLQELLVNMGFKARIT